MRLIRNTGGSMTLEAALIMPMFLAFVLFLIAMVQLAMVEIALNSAAYETTKVISARMYPVGLLVDYVDEKLKLRELTSQVVDAKKDIEDAVDSIPDQLGDLKEIIQGILQTIFDTAEGEVEKAKGELIKPLVKVLMVNLFMDKNVLKEDKISISHIEVPSFSRVDASKNFFAIEVEYKHKLFVPFFNIELTLKKGAKELIWIGS